MKFKNCAAWAKGWYKQRKNVSAWWMDLAHCINNDGWTVYTKDDVVRWCLYRFDDEPDFFKKGHGCFGFYDFYDQIKRHKEYASWDNKELSTEDAIILYFKHCLSNKSRSDFEKGGFKPASWVLPYTLHGAWYDDGKYTEDHKPKFHFAEMQCDAEERVQNMFKELDDQKPYYSFENWDAEHNFDHIESELRGKFWYDVVTDLGAEVGCDVYEVSGKKLNKQSYGVTIYVNPVNSTDDVYDIAVDLGRYSYSKGYDNNKKYKVYVNHTIKKNVWFDGEVEYTDEYEVKKIEEL